MDLYSGRWKLKASLTGPVANSAVDMGRRGDLPSIHSVFKKVINIKTSLGLISVVAAGIGKSASYIVIDEDMDFTALSIKAGDTVSFIGKCLVINNFIIDMEDAQIWNDTIGSSFKWNKTKISFENLKSFKSTVDRYAAKNSAWEKLHNDRDFNERIKKLKGDDPSKAVNCLIGLGPGLTPTGDDVLLGFMSVINTCDDYIPVREAFINEILSSLKYTSDISSYFLKMAAEGHYHEYVQNALCSMVSGLPESVSISTGKLLSIGATSGTDIAAGMYLGFSEFSRVTAPR